MAANSSTTIHPRVVLGTCCLSLLLVMMDVTVVNVVLPSIHAQLHGSFSTLQWVVDAYTLMVASLMLLVGSLADRFGRRRMFLLGIGLFCGGSALCGLARSVEMLVLARAVQGIGGSMLNPVALSILTNVYVEPRARAQAIGIWGATSGVALALGPVVGGVLVHWVGWQAVFWVNVPIGLVAIMLTLRFVPESRGGAGRGIDAPGQLLAIVALAMVTSGLIEAHNYGWASPTISGFLGFGLLSIVAFVLVEQRAAAPLIDLRFFRAWPFSGAIVIAVLAFAIFSAFLFLNTLYLQDVRGLPALQAGLCTLPFAFGSMLCAPLSGRLTGRYGARLPLLLSATGFVVSAIVLTGLDVTTPLGALLVSYGLCGCGFGMCNAPITNSAIAGMPRAQAGVAAAIASTSRQVGALLGIALGGALSAGSTGGVRWADFPQATHVVWWCMIGAALGIAALGVVSTGIRARKTAQDVAALLDSR
ncbi:MFS transporter [Komagataeibacter rhaeticus]|uniref:MFS transporter n=1 Tax=Komagataeibacter rhaeticus TaxID=215221 RepID=UPI0004D832DC|nr:MFS transporter [Komagataeibacter rhaeticus]KDU97328.1 MFS transporter [Komagataeibacter rhaeticus AF1]MBL7239825.1 MFS transporter [Komagataeibacter rhaeticus]PYD53280.1 MFS transporter [Komagataeibacter rhaeticus]GBQ12316.1 major facilitator superfamily multidrug resistance transporter QacA [Komagataeibacter rhaeticus DSM 16663]